MKSKSDLVSTGEKYVQTEPRVDYQDEGGGMRAILCLFRAGRGNEQMIRIITPPGLSLTLIHPPPLHRKALLPLHPLQAHCGECPRKYQQT